MVGILKYRSHRQFLESAELLRICSQTLAQHIEDAAGLVFECLGAGKKVLVCGNGGSASDAQHFAAELVGRFSRDRMGLAAIALTADTATITAIGNDYGFEAIFARQVQAIGSPGDVLIAISTSGNSANVLSAIDAAHEKEMHVIALTGSHGGKIGPMLYESDVHICVPSRTTARIQEAHIVALHCICDGIDTQLMGEDE